MIKTYKRDENGKPVAYFEVWVEPENRRVIQHWGIVGEPGETEAYRTPFFGSISKQVDALLAPAYAEGYETLDEDTLKVLLVEYSVDGFGDDEDLDKRHALYDRLNEILGWTGLGHCDGGSIGSGTMESACFVIDVDLATTVIADALKDTEFGDYARIYQE